MDETTPREKVLKRIRNALISKTENPYPSLDMDSSVYHEFTDPPDITFAQQFVKVGGRFVYCENEMELKNNLISLFAEKHLEEVFCSDPTLIETLNKTGISNYDDREKFLKSEATVTCCEYLIARYGSIVVSSKQPSGRRANVYPKLHIVIATTDQIVSDIKDALKGLKKKYETQFPSMISVITGPSRTADIEKTLVMGAHGPKELYVFLLDEVKNKFYGR
jgi:L-lactate dehydrogenase complex protein LldG